MTTSHADQRIGNKAATSTDALMLADAFSEFISASSRLETFYGDLQQEVSQLGQELTERNAALTASLSATESVRQFLVDVVDALPCGVAVVESDGNISLLNREAGRLLDVNAGTGCSVDVLSRRTGVDLGIVLTTCVALTDEEFDCGPSGFRFHMRCRSLRRAAGHALLIVLHDLTLHPSHGRREPSFSPVMLASIATAITQQMRASLASQPGRQLVLDIVTKTLRPDTHHS